MRRVDPSMATCGGDQDRCSNSIKFLTINGDKNTQQLVVNIHIQVHFNRQTEHIFYIQRYMQKLQCYISEKGINMKGKCINWENSTIRPAPAIKLMYNEDNSQNS